MVKNKLALGLLISIGVLVASAFTFIILSFSGIAPILRNEITIISPTYTKVYDGKSTDFDDYTLKGTLYSGDYLDISFDENSGDVGTYDNSFDVVVRNKSGHDVTANYKVNSTFGVITVTTRPIKVSVKSETENYNGQKLSAKDYILDGNLVEGDKLDVTYEGSITEIGEAVASFLYVHVINADGRDVSSNYNISTADGYLVKQLIPLTFTSNSDSKDYDGSELKKETYSQVGDVLDGDSVTVTFNSSLTNVGLVNNEFNVSITNGTTDVSHHYQITKEYGTLQVNEKVLLLGSKSDHWEYDGQEHKTADSVALVVMDGLATTDQVTVHYTNSVTNVTTSVKNTFTASITNIATGDDVSKNYVVKYSYGYLDIDPIEIRITTANDSKVYDGTALSNSTLVECEDSKLLTGHSLVYTSSPVSITDVGSVQNSRYLKVVDSNGVNVTSNYSLVYTYGTLTITKRELTIQASSSSKKYDGTKLESEDWYLINGDTASGEKLKVIVECEESDFKGKADETQVKKNNITWSITDMAGNVLPASSNNYDVTVIPGELVIFGTVKKVVYLTPENVLIYKDEFNSIKTQNGGSVEADYFFEEYDYTNILSPVKKALPSGVVTTAGIKGFEDYETDGYKIAGVTVTGTLDNSGLVVTTITDVEIRDVTGSIVTTSEFDVHFLTGTFRVCEGTITISSPSGSKAYDGTALTSVTPGITISTGENLDIDVSVTGSQTVVGVSSNTIELNGVYAETDTTHSTNLKNKYEIIYTPGTLEVTRAELIINTLDETGSGASVSNNNIPSANVTGLAAGHELYNVVTSVLTNIGDMDNEIISWHVKDAAGNDVTDNYYLSASCVWGKLEKTA